MPRPSCLFYPRVYHPAAPPVKPAPQRCRPVFRKVVAPYPTVNLVSRNIDLVFRNIAVACATTLPPASRTAAIAYCEIFHVICDFYHILRRKFLLH
jgi:hypothetical protein